MRKVRIDRLKELLARTREPRVLVVRYIIPGYLEDYPGPPEEVVRAAVEEAKREGRPVAVIYWHPPEGLVRQVEEELRRRREEDDIEK